MQYEHSNYYLAPILAYTASISSTAWTHLTVVYTSNKPALYVNGTAVMQLRHELTCNAGTLVQQGLQSLYTVNLAPQYIGHNIYGSWAGRFTTSLICTVSCAQRGRSAYVQHDTVGGTGAGSVQRRHGCQYVTLHH